MPVMTKGSKHTKDALIKMRKAWDDRRAKLRFKKIIKEQPKTDDLVDEIIDCVLQNSYVESMKTSDGAGRKFYDNQLFPERGCEEKVKRLLQKTGIM